MNSQTSEKAICLAGDSDTERGEISLPDILRWDGRGDIPLSQSKVEGVARRLSPCAFRFVMTIQPKPIAAELGWHPRM